MNKKVIKIISLSTLCISFVGIIGTAVGASISISNYSEYNNYRNIYDLASKSTNPDKSKVSFKEFIVDMNNQNDGMTSKQRAGSKRMNQYILSKFYSETPDGQKKEAASYGLSKTDYRELLLYFQKVNFIEANPTAFIASVSMMVIFMVIALASGTIHYKNDHHKFEIYYQDDLIEIYDQNKIEIYDQNKPLGIANQAKLIRMNNQGEPIKLGDQSELIKIAYQAELNKINNQGEPIRIINQAKLIKLNNHGELIGIVNQSDLIKIDDQAELIKKIIKMSQLN